MEQGEGQRNLGSAKGDAGLRHGALQWQVMLAPNYPCLTLAMVAQRTWQRSL